MAKQKPDMSCARVVQYKASGLDMIYRHNERRNESYGNENVITEMSRYNIHFKDPGDETYTCLLYTSPSPRDPKTSRMPSSA